jgi:hypothetical protein
MEKYLYKKISTIFYTQEKRWKILKRIKLSFFPLSYGRMEKKIQLIIFHF